MATQCRIGLYCNPCLLSIGVEISPAGESVFSNFDTAVDYCTVSEFAQIEVVERFIDEAG